MFVFQLSIGQTVEISGRVESKDNIENIHVINQTQQKFTITNAKGEFVIPVKLNDTLTFSSIQNKLKTVIVDKQVMLFKVLKVVLEEQVNTLDEVIVGKILTGNLLLDVQNIKGDPPINFYDVGIPGYTGKPATQSERRLNEATTGSGIIPLNPIINAISGRTKMLKARVKLEEREELIQAVRGRLAKDFFASNPLNEELKMDFFYFCSDDENFLKHCKNETDFNILLFLRTKYRQYIKNVKTSQD